jgi:hypothetical protein
MRKVWLTATALCGTIAFSAAPAAYRTLPVPADKGWMHAQTKLILRAQMAGLARTGLSDSTATEHDIAAQFENADHSISATLYLFHSALPEPAVWFDRSRLALEQRDLFRHAAPASEAPLAFAASGTVASSLRQTYAIVDGPFRSTALAVMPLGEWLVVVRMSAKEKAATLDRQMSDFISALRLPADPSATIATPVVACATPLHFTKAKMVKPEPTDLLVSLISGAAARETKDQPAPPRRHWCREGDPGDGFAAYRGDDQTGDASGYTLAMQDAGRVVRVNPSLMSQLDREPAGSEKKAKINYTVTLADVDERSLTFPSFAGLPAPRQVYEAVAKQRPVGMAKGKQVTLDSNTFK